MVMRVAATQPEIRTIPAGEFKAKCLQLMDEVNEKNLTLVTRDKQLLAYGRKGHLSVRTL